MRKYLEISPNATDAADVNGMIAKIESTPEKAK
jgi:hypothetical protein